MAIANIFGRDFYQGLDADMAICVPRVDGALFWATDTLKLYCWSGAAWNEVGAGAGGNVATDAIWDAKGDLAVGTGADTASKLTVGADGKILYAASGEATGLKWDTAPSGSVATDAIWDAKGDLAVGTGANTSSKFTAGADGKILYAAAGEATGLKWDTAPSGSVATDAIWDAKGDLAVGTGANTSSKLTAGSNGLFLYAASGEATGVKWSSPAFMDWNTKAGSISASAYAFKGNFYEPSSNILLYAIGYYGTVVASAVYKAMVITESGGTIASIVATSESITMNAAMGDTTLHTIWMRFAIPVQLTAETKYGFIYGRTDDADNYVLPVPSSTTAGAPFGSDDGVNETVRIAENDPIVGTAVNSSTDNVAMGFMWIYT
jgi:hypothetical protein